jgi:hypothetical protein
MREVQFSEQLDGWHIYLLRIWRDKSISAQSCEISDEINRLVPRILNLWRDILISSQNYEISGEINRIVPRIMKSLAEKIDY